MSSLEVFSWLTSDIGVEAEAEAAAIAVAAEIW